MEREKAGLHDSSERVAAVLQLVIQHCPEVSERAVLKLLQINQTCGRAVQQSLGHFRIRSWQVQNLAKLADFCSWFVAHAGLVSEIDLDCNQFSSHNHRAAEQLLTFAFRECCRNASASTAAADAVASSLAGAATTQHVGSAKSRSAALQLRSLSANFIQSAAVLQPLASCSTLTNLHLVEVPCRAVTGPFCSALGTLRSLKRLHFSTALPTTLEEPTSLPRCFASAVQHLQQLTQLQVLQCKVPQAVLPLLPAKLEVLILAVAHEAEPPAVLDLQQLHNLQELHIDVPGGVAQGSMLPAATTSLSLLGPAEALEGLPNLRRLSLHRPAGCMPMLRSLAARSSVQQLAVGLWACPVAQMPQVFDSLSAATQLTALQLYQQHMDGDVDAIPLPLGGLQLHKYLSKLRALQDLQVQQLDIHNSDALQFTALSSLTALHLNETPKVGDLAVSAIICRLPRLQKLLLWGCKLESPTLWPVCATATQLVHLELGQAPVLSEESLQLLLPLQQLTYLFVGGQQGEENVSTGAWQAFIDAMPVLEEFEMP